jgi:hypothetical protein
MRDEGEAMIRRSIIVRADWDDAAAVWVATSADIAGLAVEADSVEALAPKVAAAVADLLELNGLPGDGADVPVHIMAERVVRASVA